MLLKLRGSKEFYLIATENMVQDMTARTQPHMRPTAQRIWSLRPIRGHPTGTERTMQYNSIYGFRKTIWCQDPPQEVQKLNAGER